MRASALGLLYMRFELYLNVKPHLISNYAPPAPQNQKKGKEAGEVSDGERCWAGFGNYCGV